MAQVRINQLTEALTPDSDALVAVQLPEGGTRSAKLSNVRHFPKGEPIRIGTGTNATAGKATLVAGTVVVNTTKVTANSLILLTGQEIGTLAGRLRVSARTAGTSFTILSSDNTDTADVAWLIIEPFTA